MELMEYASKFKIMEIYLSMKVLGLKINIMEKALSSLSLHPKIRRFNFLDGLKEIGKTVNFKAKDLFVNIITPHNNGMSNIVESFWKIISMGKDMRYSMEIVMKEVSKMAVDTAKED